MSDAATLKALTLVRCRRLGSNRVHLALVMPDTLMAGTFAGQPVTHVGTPVAAWCGRTLRGTIIAIPEPDYPGWRKAGHVCEQCITVAAAGLALAEARA